MRTVIALTRRNIKNFLRNKPSVFFSFIAIIIIIVLYALFLAPTQMTAITDLIPGDHVSAKDIQYLVDSWIMPGVLIISSITIPFGSMSIFAMDYEMRIIGDFLVSPLKRYQLSLSYILSSYIIGILFTSLNFLLAEVIIVLMGGSFLSFVQVLQAMGILLIVTLCSTSILFFLTTFLKGINAFSIASTIIGTGIGFLAGVYVPIGMLPAIAQGIIKGFPLYYGSVMLRQVFMEEPLLRVFGSEGGAALESYLREYGVTAKLFGVDIELAYMIGSLLIVTLIFMILSFLRVRKMKFK